MRQKVYIREGLFTEAPKGLSLLASKCPSCGRTYFPKAETCLDCLHDSMEVITLSQCGRLFAYTIVHVPSTHFQPPYAVGFVDLPERVRIFAPLVIDDNRPFQVGMEMEIQVDTLWQDAEKEFVGYSFTPV